VLKYTELGKKKEGKALTDNSYFQNVLVPVDGSRFSLQAEEVALDIAKRFNSRVTVLYVVPHAILHPPTGQYREVPSSIRKEMEGMFVQKGRQALSQAKVLFGGEKVLVDTILEEFADPPETILDVAKERKTNLVVMGNRGTSEIEDFTLGGVAEKVSKYAKCPVLLVKKGTAVSKILVAIDGSKHAQRALEHTVQLASKYRAAVTLLNVAQTFLPQINVEKAKSMGERILADAAEKVEGLKVDKKVEVGHPAKTIIDFAKKGNYDLIAVGCRGLNPAKRFFMGSVSDKVSRHAQCSVLIVK
jgi:nucleotide-binding universal stress UspA family protein